MAIFGFKKEGEKKPKAEKKAKAVKAVKTTSEAKTGVAVTTDVLSSIVNPRVTEKSGILSQSGVYTFEISKNANKTTVAKAIRALYKVTPVKVAIINTPSKSVFVKGRKGTVSGFRKAVVTVKKGEKIDFV